MLLPLRGLVETNTEGRSYVPAWELTLPVPKRCDMLSAHMGFGFVLLIRVWICSAHKGFILYAYRGFILYAYRGVFIILPIGVFIILLIRGI